MSESARLHKIRDDLKDHSERGMLGAIAAYSKVPEWIIQDWCHSPEHVPTQDEVLAIEQALAMVHRIEDTQMALSLSQ
jgi:hypothetical protein